jgi:hypothetical protein
MILNDVRSSLLAEAKNSPNLLADIAGLELYVAESYNNKSVLELLQNADDCGATDSVFFIKDNFLFAANNGRPFTANDLESLCRSASSNKFRGSTIGYRGIGFKAVVAYSKSIHVVSGITEFTFSRDLTRLSLQTSQEVPLIRIPHQIDSQFRFDYAETIEKILELGYKTIFAFELFDMTSVEKELADFSETSLLFLRNINTLKIGWMAGISFKVQRIQNELNSSKVEIDSKNGKRSWSLIKNNKIDIAFQIRDDELVQMEKGQALIHAFLPTEESTCFRVIFNADFSTDPSRKRLIFDDLTQLLIRNVAQSIIDLIDAAINNNNRSASISLNVLIPDEDLRLMHLKSNSFDRILSEQILALSSARFNALYICPSWFNVVDFNKLLGLAGHKVLSPDLYEMSSFIPFMKFIGAKELDPFKLFDYSNSGDISILGCAQLTASVFKRILSKSMQPSNDLMKFNLFFSDNRCCSLLQIKTDHTTVDRQFIDLLADNGLLNADLKRVIALLDNELQFAFENSVTSDLNLGGAYQSSQVEEQIYYPFKNEKNSESKINHPLSTAMRWRSAEENTLIILNSSGFNLVDVSKRNIGYDLEGYDPSGSPVQIEVKSITEIGQSFRLTNNEVAIAQSLPKTYYIAIVRQLPNRIEISFINDPVRNLQLDRHCVQWVWECSKYDYKPRIFEI